MATSPSDRVPLGPLFVSRQGFGCVAEGVAERLGVTVAQVSLAWVLSKGVVPIPGARHIAHLEANWAAGELDLDAVSMAELEAAFPVGSTVGARYPAGSPPAPGLQPA
jgi:aryl-alcohol dehydrogenase-like predicted oxidoreductase